MILNIYVKEKNMGNNEIKDSEIPDSYFSLYNNNYLANCYNYLIRSKSVHFIISLIEALINIIQELFIFQKAYNIEQKNQNNFWKFIFFIPGKIESLAMIIKIMIVLIYIIVFDIIYYFLGKLKYKSYDI